MNATDQNSQIIKGLLENSPGFFGVLSLDSKLLTVNKTGLQWIGFNSTDSVGGVSYDNLRCRAAEDADFFVWQDELVKKYGRPIYFLGCYCYANDDWKLIFGKKYLIQDDEGRNTGIISQFDDVTHYRMIDVSRFMIDAQEKFINKKDNKQFCFLLNDCLQQIQLSTRELECLFFLLRGKTNKGIATILSLSPRTVESYIEQIKYKMGCASREELVEKSIYKGYFNILPSSLLQKQLVTSK